VTVPPTSNVLTLGTTVDVPVLGWPVKLTVTDEFKGDAVMISVAV